MAILKNSFIHIYTHAHSKICQNIILTFLLLLDIFIGLIIDELVKGQRCEVELLDILTIHLII